MTSIDINYILTPGTILLDWILEEQKSVYPAETTEIAILC